MDIQLTQLTKNSFVDPTGLIHIINLKTDKTPWIRDHYCVDCKVVRRVNAATFTVGERCPACWKKDAAKKFVTEVKTQAAQVYAALRAQVKS